MYYTKKSKSQSRAVGIGVVVALHLLLVWAVASGAGRKAIEKVKELKTDIIKEAPPPTEEPPPPPPPDEIDIAPPMDVVPPPNFSFDTVASVNAVRDVVKSNDSPPVKPPPAPPKVDPPPKPKPPAVKAQPSLPTRIEKPDYPRAAERGDQEGITTMRVCVDAKGKVSESKVTVSSGFPLLDDAAIEWINDLRGIKPAMVDGKAVDGGCMIVPLEWKIEKR
jgi:periplasmic protein TonB